MRTVFRDDHELFRQTARRFVEKEIVPHLDEWEHAGIVPKSLWLKAGEAGLLCSTVPEEYGGSGGDFGHSAVMIEELARANATAVGFTTHSEIVAPYIVAYGTEEQKQRWLPRMVSGTLIGVIAMSEPGIGSDLRSMRTTARRDGDDYIVNGQKTFITNGGHAGLMVTATKLDPLDKKLTLICVEEDRPGFAKGKLLEKIGLKGQDTSELFFDNVQVAPENLLGKEEGQGFVQLMQQLPQERLSLAVSAVASMERAVKLTTEYTKERKAFGKPLMDFQNTAFTLAERKTEAMIARVFVDWCVERLVAGDLDTVTASMAKWWCSQKQVETADECLQLHGGYGYMQEYPISRMFVDSRIQKIYGGTNEIMKLLIARSL